MKAWVTVLWVCAATPAMVGAAATAEDTAVAKAHAHNAALRYPERFVAVAGMAAGWTCG